MDQETLKLRRLFAQYLLAPDSRLHVVRAMDGFQAQFLSNAMHAMRLRSADPDAGYAADGLVKSWTLRGTMHLFAEADLPLFLHDGCRYHSRDWTVPSFWNQRPDWALTPQRQAYFSDLIVDTLTQGPMTREALKVRCRAAGMTEAEEASMFHPWGGGIRELCERGFSQRGKSLPALPTIRADGQGRRTAGAAAAVSGKLRPGLAPGRRLLFCPPAGEAPGTSHAAAGQRRQL